MLSRGFAAIKKAKQRSDQKRAEFQSSVNVRDLFLQGDGAEVEVWPNGDPDQEPVVTKTHTLRLPSKRNPSKPFIRTEVCARGEDKHEGCVYCWAEGHGDKRVGKASDTTVISVVDGRWVHKILNDEKTKASKDGKYERFDWYDCSDDEKCKLCRKKVPRERAGQKKFRMSITAAAAFDGENESMMRRCTNCGGKIKITGYTNGKKTVGDLDSVKDPEGWEPVRECRGCDDPKPASIFSGPLTIRRNGVGLTTSYSFKGSIEEMPDWVLEYEPVDLEKALRPRSADGQAKLLGVSNPFEPWSGSGGKVRDKSGAEPYEEEEESATEEEADDPFDN